MSNRGRVLSVNVGGVRDLLVRDVELPTGIFKAPRRGPVAVVASGLEGDARVAPPKYGAENHAVHVYPSEHYAYWAARFGEGPFAPGGFGENLTVEGALESEIRVGDVVACGTARLVVTQPRIPCRKLSARVGIPSFARVFLESYRVGYYLRVEAAGTLQGGDDFVIVASDSSAPTITEFVAVVEREYWDAAALEQILGARALPEAWRPVVEDKLARARRAVDEGGWFGSRTLRVAASEREGARAVLTFVCPRGRALPRIFGRRSMQIALLHGEHRGARRTCEVWQEREEAYLVSAAHDGDEVSRAIASLCVGDDVRCQAPQG